MSARVEAASITLAWDANTETDLARYLVGYRTSPTGTETLVDVGLVTSWTLTTATAGNTYYFRVYAENTLGLRSAPSAQVSQLVGYTPPTGGGFALDRGRLLFGAVRAGSTTTSQTPGQSLVVARTSGTGGGWTATTNQSWLRVTPASGTGTGTVTVSVVPGTRTAGTYDGTVTIRVTSGGINLSVPVRMRIYNSGQTTVPTGFVDTPADGTTNVAGAIPVTGWAADDVAVNRVDVYRDPVGAEGGLVFLGTAAFVSGARPDIENWMTETPLNYRAGWGLLVLTNVLPDIVNNRSTGGNGTYRLHAFAVDAEGHSTFLGSRRFTANNSGSNRPFGSIDTPSQGGTASGSNYLVWGWALSPGATIPTNGQSITVMVDGNPVGHPTYNLLRADIAGLFPSYANSSGPVGYFRLDTTQLANGLHTISWVVTDAAGRSQGIGSRYFTVLNGAADAPLTMAQAAAVPASAGAVGPSVGQSVDHVTADMPVNNSVVEVARAASDDPMPQQLYPEWAGDVTVQSTETEALEVRLANQFTDGLGGTYEGYMIVRGEMRALPAGSSLDTAAGVFRWQPGPGVVGEYSLVFLRSLPDGGRTKIPVRIRVNRKFERDDRVQR